MKIDLDCREASRLISEDQDQPLPTSQRARLRLHFVWCEACRDVQAQLDFLRRAMRDLGPDRPPEP